MPLLLYPLLAGGAGFGLGFWAGDGFSSLLKIGLFMLTAYLLYRWGIRL